MNLESQNKSLKKRNCILEIQNKKYEKYLKSLNRQLLKEYHQVKEKLDVSQEVIKNLSSENERLKVNIDSNSKCQSTNQNHTRSEQNTTLELDNKEKSCDQYPKKIKKDQWMINQTKFDQNIRNQNARIQSLTKSLQQKDEIIRLLKNRIVKKNELSVELTEKFKILLNKVT